MEAVIEIKENLNAQQDVMDILQETVYLLFCSFPHDANLNRITKDDWTYCWGKPCEWYVQGCVTCDRWKLWTKLTGETIENEAHEEDCECNECPTVEKRIVYVTVKLVVKETADIEEVEQETDYGFNHPDVLSTKWMESKEVFEEES